tara:strand:- start:645 stop:869 length:225 start_codon:yes stop_codon:yes gene_type:complete
MQDNVINFEEALEEQDKALDKALKEVSFYQKKYFGCLTENKEIREENKEIREENKEIKKMNKAMEKIIKKIAEQ